MLKGSFQYTTAALLASAILLTACGGGPPVEVSDPEGFQRLEAAGPFSVAIPEELSRVPVIGVDTELDEFVGEGVRLGFSYGANGSLPPSQGLLDYTTGEIRVDGRPGKWVEYTRSHDSGDGLLYGWVAHIGAPDERGVGRGEPTGLTIYLSCNRKQTCELGPGIAQTVRFDR